MIALPAHGGVRAVKYPEGIPGVPRGWGETFARSDADLYAEGALCKKFD